MLTKQELDNIRAAIAAGAIRDELTAKLLDHIAELEEDVSSMARICEGMTLEEMQNAPFTYKALLEIVQRRESKEQQNMEKHVEVAASIQRINNFAARGV